MNTYKKLAPSSMSFPRYGHLKFGRDPPFSALARRDSDFVRLWMLIIFIW